MYQNYHDCMALVSHCGKPSLFVTMTTNPNWPEIQRELLPGQTTSDRPDLVARVFKMKLHRLWHEIMYQDVFGTAVGGTYVVEYQKRGLPHVHMLIILRREEWPTTAEEIDKIVCAELPNRDTHPDLWKTVTATMLHGPCGKDNPDQRCMEDGRCRYNFPHRYQEYTTLAEDGYPHYRRRQNGVFVEQRGHASSQMFRFTNRWVVPYNPYLVGKYDCHINVQIATTIEAVKYLYKYVFKGNPQAAFTLVQDGEVRDEIADYLKGRYICPAEACFRIFGGSITENIPPVTRLTIHEEGRRTVILDESSTVDTVRNGKPSKLEAFFKYCAENPPAEGESGMLYTEAPIHLTWDDKKKEWKRRQRGMAVGRMFWVPHKLENVSTSAAKRLTAAVLYAPAPGLRTAPYVFQRSEDSGR